MDKRKTIGFVSLGCPKALVDSEKILTRLRAEGYETAETYEDAGLVIINTCGFITAAQEESIETISEALSENGKVIVTGCLGAKKDRQMIRTGETCAEISACAENRYGEIFLEAKIYENRREIRINGNKISRNADLLGNINGVFFSPGELRLVQDGPEERRRFLNVSISQMSKNYYTALVRYNKILEHLL